MNQATNLQKARTAWGAALPDWVEALAGECDTASQTKVATVVGYSGSAISQVISNRYGHNGGDIGAIEAAVRGAFMGGTVQCPVLGTTPINACLRHQRSKLVNTNPQRVQLFRACRRCKHRRAQ